MQINNFFMSLFTSFFSSAARVRKKTEERLTQHHTDQKNFYVLIILAGAIATLGLILDAPAIVIGAMVVAPLITPVFGLSLNLLVFNFKQAGISFLMILGGTAVAILASIIMTWFVMFIDGHTIILTSEIISRTQTGILYFIIALLSGVAGAYSYAKPEILASIAGIAISVAVIPPIAVSGIGIATLDLALVESSLSLYLLNLVGISFGSILMFVSLGFGNET